MDFLVANRKHLPALLVMLSMATLLAAIVGPTVCSDRLWDRYPQTAAAPMNSAGYEPVATPSPQPMDRYGHYPDTGQRPPDAIDRVTTLATTDSTRNSYPASQVISHQSLAPQYSNPLPADTLPISNRRVAQARDNSPIELLPDVPIPAPVWQSTPPPFSPPFSPPSSSHGSSTGEKTPLLPEGDWTGQGADPGTPAQDNLLDDSRNQQDGSLSSDNNLSPSDPGTGSNSPSLPAAPPMSAPPMSAAPMSVPPMSAPPMTGPPTTAAPGTTPPVAAPIVAPHGTAATPPLASPPGVDPHAEVFSKGPYPSAKECRACHEQIYDEWAVSSHAYAAVSPTFNKFEQTINSLTRGTIGYFCIRCHSPVGTALGHERWNSVFASVPAAAEGVTCVACHRVREQYGKVSGERRIEPGGVHDPMYGSGYGEGLEEVIAKKDFYKVKPEPGMKGPGQDIHNRVIHFEQLSSSHFCTSCHQVSVLPGIALEVVWNQYRASPACREGISCQDCHMGSEPGIAAGYPTGPVAVVNDKPVSPNRKHSNHMFYGPGYSIAHPGLFPLHPKSDRWTVEQWLQFDYRAGWGTDDFEDALDEEKSKGQFPPAWDNADDRYDAREIVNENLKKLEAKRHMRHRLMENGSDVQGPFFRGNPAVGNKLKFYYQVTNTNSGHNMPSGSLGAQPQLWLNVSLTGPYGEHLWESGYVDSSGDVADMHSLDVHAKRIAPDHQLFILQTKFLITHVKGTDRESYLPINTDIDPLPFIRPSGFPITVMNHPPFIRMEGHSIPPLGSRDAKYVVPAHLIRTPGNYRLSVRMRSRANPIYFLKYCDSTPEMIRNMNYWMVDSHAYSTDFIVR